MIDTHSHIDLPMFEDSFSEVLAGARRAGVQAQVLPGVLRSGWQRILQLSAEEPDLFAAIGLHPLYLDYHRQEDLQELQCIAQTGKLVAVGEIGLDYYVKDLDRSAQQDLFEAQLLIAAEAGLPVLLHVRKAHDQVQAIIRRTQFGGGGIVHAFSGSLQQAEQYIKLGFLISICGTVTYERARKIRAVAGALPLASLVLETDSPDIPPAAHYGECNYPEYLPDIAMGLSVLRTELYEEVVLQTEKNSRRILSLCK